MSELIEAGELYDGFAAASDDLVVLLQPSEDERLTVPANSVRHEVG